MVVVTLCPLVRGKRGAERGDRAHSPTKQENNSMWGDITRTPGSRSRAEADKAPTCYQNTKKKKKKPTHK